MKSFTGSICLLIIGIFFFPTNGSTLDSSQAEDNKPKHFHGGEKIPAARCYIEVTKDGKPFGMVLDVHSKGGIIMPGASGRHDYYGGTARDAAKEVTQDWTKIKLAEVSKDPIYEDKFMRVFKCTPEDSSELDVLKSSFSKSVFVANPDTGEVMGFTNIDMTPRYKGDDMVWKKLYPQP